MFCLFIDVGILLGHSADGSLDEESIKAFQPAWAKSSGSSMETADQTVPDLVGCSGCSYIQTRLSIFGPSVGELAVGCIYTFPLK